MRWVALAVMAMLAACSGPEREERHAIAPVTQTEPVIKAPQPTAPAAPVLSGHEAMDTPLVCLSRAVYFEARGRAKEDLSAVAHVVLNRVRSPRFPASVCAVVKQGGPDAPCQFSWWCDGRSDIASHRTEYTQAVRAAYQALEGHSEDPTKGAHFFHHRRISPAWSKRTKRTVQIGPHIFYRLRS